MKTGTLIPAIPAALLAWVQYANADLPRYNPTAYCDQVAAFGGAPSNVIRSGCLEREQTAHDDLLPLWDQLSSTLRRHCDEEAQSGGGGSFVFLKASVEEEQNADRNTKLQR